ncbi:MAG: hypothetical protein HDS23_06255 [Bacteroides sp.]|nr:hypothetical protein [Bacteroides sp.]
MKQNPFSLYDFLGYVFPGALALMIIAFFNSSTDKDSIKSILSSGIGFLQSSRNSGMLDLVEETVILTIIAYVLGHIIAYLSSLTVESYSIWLFGYPSTFLLNDSCEPQRGLYWQLEPVSGNTIQKCVELVWRCIVGAFLLPVTLCYLIMGKLMGMKNFFTKPLDKTLRTAINDNQQKLAESLGISKQQGDDFHRVVYHYEYERQTHHMPKLDNYVALYGFLRALTFIMASTTLWITIVYIIPTLGIEGKVVDWSLVWLFISLVLLTYICFMAFMKFYRRFTLESFMCLVVDNSYKETHIMPYTYVPSNELVMQPSSQSSTNDQVTSTTPNSNISATTSFSSPQTP